MTTTDRLNKIASVAENVKKNEEPSFADHVATYAERIRAIIEVGSALVRNKMPLGKHDCFQTNTWDHRFGFMVTGDRLFNPNNWRIVGIGRVGGGWVGNDFIFDNLLVSFEGEVIEYDGIYTCESWTKDFEQFEKDFYNYVDNEI